MFRIDASADPPLSLSPSPPVSPVFPEGFQLSNIDARSADEVWAVATCGRGAWRELADTPARMKTVLCGDDPPFYSNLLRFDGQNWSKVPSERRGPTQATRANVALRDLLISERDGFAEVWTAGDWMTVAYRRDLLR
jgi:hypothetical protein